MNRTREEQAGATSVEYALMAGLIALVIITSVMTMGLATTDLFGGYCGELETAGEPCP